jgi:hypothetical protein
MNTAAFMFAGFIENTSIAVEYTNTVGLINNVLP